jgi:hypothetical protein
MSSIRARIAHVFRMLECQFGYTKARYEGIVENAALLFVDLLQGTGIVPSVHSVACASTCSANISSKARRAAPWQSRFQGTKD